MGETRENRDHSTLIIFCMLIVHSRCYTKLNTLTCILYCRAAAVFICKTPQHLSIHLSAERYLMHGFYLLDCVSWDHLCKSVFTDLLELSSYYLVYRQSSYVCYTFSPMFISMFHLCLFLCFILILFLCFILCLFVCLLFCVKVSTMDCKLLPLCPDAISLGKVPFVDYLGGGDGISMESISDGFGTSNRVQRF